MRKLIFDLPEGHCVVRRVAGYGPVHLPHSQTYVEEGGYFHMSYDEVYERKDWEQVDAPPDELYVEDGTPEPTIDVAIDAALEVAEPLEDTNGDSIDPDHEDWPVPDSASDGVEPGPDLGNRRHDR